MSLATVIGGAGAFLSLIGGENTLVAKVATLVLTVVGAIQVIFRIDTAAASHKQWLTRFLRLLYEVRSTPSPPDEMINRWVLERYEIEAECIGEMRALQADCYNRTMSAMQLEGSPYKLRWWQRAFCQVWSFESSVSG